MYICRPHEYAPSWRGLEAAPCFLDSTLPVFFVTSFPWEGKEVSVVCACDWSGYRLVDFCFRVGPVFVSCRYKAVGAGHRTSVQIHFAAVLLVLKKS